MNTAKYLIYAASKFGNLKRLTFWRSFFFGGFSAYCPLKLSVIIGATFKGKNMLPMVGLLRVSEYSYLNIKSSMNIRHCQNRWIQSFFFTFF